MRSAMNMGITVLLLIGLTNSLWAMGQTLDLIDVVAPKAPKGPVFKTAPKGPTPPKWPSKFINVPGYFWGTNSERNWQDWPKGIGLIKAMEVVEKFVILCLKELKYEKQILGVKDDVPGYGITLEELLTKFCHRWRSNTPYYQNGLTEVPGALGRLGSGNTWAKIFKNGWGICGDHAQLLIYMTEVAVNNLNAREVVDLVHLRDSYMDRVKEVGMVGLYNKTHGACGVLSKEAYERIKYNKGVTQTDGSIKLVKALSTQSIGRYDVKVFDLWAKPYRTNEYLAKWAADFNASNFRSIACHYYTILWDKVVIYHSKAK